MKTFDPFDMKQVMWAVSTKVNPAGDVIMLPNMSIDVLDPASQPDGISHKMVVGVWTLYRCKTCLYAWRSTEPEENTNPDKYPAAFRLSPDDVANFPIVPNIPPLREK